MKQLAASSGVSLRCLFNWKSKHANVGDYLDSPLGRDGVYITGDTATIVTLTRASGENVTPDEVLKDEGLDPEHWDVVSYTSNKWHAPTATGRELFEQTKLVARRRVESILKPAKSRKAGWIPPKPRLRKRTAKRLIAALGDPHAPLEETDFVEAQCAWLSVYQPDEIYLMGDAADNSPWKRHKKNRRIDCTAQQALDATYAYLSRIRAAAPNARIVLVYGNHDYWIIDRIMETVPQLGTLRRADGTQIVSLADWLRLDELHIETVEVQGEYHDHVVQILPDLIGLHGVASGPYGGAVKEFNNWEGASVIQGHDHKGALVLLSKRLPDGGDVQRIAASVGTSARRDLGYDHKRNVCQSFLTITVTDDHTWHPELAIFNPQTRTTTWRDFAYTPKRSNNDK